MTPHASVRFMSARPTPFLSCTGRALEPVHTTMLMRGVRAEKSQSSGRVVLNSSPAWTCSKKELKTFTCTCTCTHWHTGQDGSVKRHAVLEERGGQGVCICMLTGPEKPFRFRFQWFFKSEPRNINSVYCVHARRRKHAYTFIFGKHL